MIATQLLELSCVVVWKIIKYLCYKFTEDWRQVLLPSDLTFSRQGFHRQLFSRGVNRDVAAEPTDIRCWLGASD